MAELETNAPETAYATKTNIVVPHARAGGQPAATIAARAKLRIEERIGKSGGNEHQGHAPVTGSTISVTPTLKQEA